MNILRFISLIFFALGFLTALLVNLMGINKYGFNGGLDCDSEIRSFIYWFISLFFTLLGTGLHLLNNKNAKLKDHKIIYVMFTVTILLIALKGPEYYNEFTNNKMHCP